MTYLSMAEIRRRERLALLRIMAADEKPHRADVLCAQYNELIGELPPISRRGMGAKLMGMHKAGLVARHYASTERAWHWEPTAWGHDIAAGRAEL